MSRTKPSISASLSHYPTGWDESKVNRHTRSYATRFRISKAFEGLNLHDGIGSSTKAGYESLIRLLLTYSAYEKFSSAFGLTSRKQRTKIEEKNGVDGRLTELRLHGKKITPLFDFLHEHTSSASLKQNLIEIRNCRDGSLVLLAEAVRHCFAHGSLTPNSWGQDPEIAATVFDLLSSHLMKIMEEETGPRMNGMKS